MQDVWPDVYSYQILNKGSSHGVSEPSCPQFCTVHPAQNLDCDSSSPKARPTNHSPPASFLTHSSKGRINPFYPDKPNFTFKLAPLPLCIQDISG
jgi:hypothetical protein